MERKYKMKNTLIILLISFSAPIFSQWVQTSGTPEGSGVTGMVAKGEPYNWIFVSTGSVSGGQQGGIRRSLDGGATWTNLHNCFIARTIIQSDYGVLASIWNFPTQNEGVYRMDPVYHNTWIPIYNFPSVGNNIFSLLNPIDSIILGGTRTGILRSTNSGASFNFSNNGIPANSWVWDLAAGTNNVIAAATSNGLFISTNFGDSWQQTTGVPAGDTVKCITFARYAADANNDVSALFAGTDDGKILIANNQTFYLAVVVANLVDPGIQFEKGYTVRQDLENFDHVFFTGRPRTNQNGGGVYHNENGGQTFNQINGGLPQNPIVSAITGIPGPTSKELIIGFFNNTNNGGPVFKSTVPIGIHQSSTNMPDGFQLSQNYPNPFNPSTNIEFAIPNSSFVKLVVYNMLGREVETLVSKDLKAGKYKADWNASNFAGGVYFYKLFSKNFAETRKMILIK